MKISKPLFSKMCVYAAYHVDCNPASYSYFCMLRSELHLFSLDRYIFERPCCYLVFHRFGEVFSVEVVVKPSFVGVSFDEITGKDIKGAIRRKNKADKRELKVVF